ncbi:MAG: hypothetical protein M5R40_02890 [Anaerolineae bacterium]|nr:hypothetical protein [Anaerolineae bacterium]
MKTKALLLLTLLLTALIACEPLVPTAESIVITETPLPPTATDTPRRRPPSP